MAPPATKQCNSLTSQQKVLFIHHGKGLGGAPLSLLYLIQGLDKTRYQPIVLFLHQSEVVDLYKKHNIDIIGPINLMDFPHTKIWWLRWYHVPTLMRAIKDTLTTMFFVAPRIFEQLKPNIVHLNTSSLIGWAFAAHRKKIPVAWHIREPLANGYFGVRKWIIRHCVQRYANAIIPISTNDAKPWSTDKKTTVVYNAVQPTRFDAAIKPESFLARYKLDHATPKILFLGGLSEEKGTLVILEAFKRLQQMMPNVQLLIAGSCPWSQQSSSFKQFFPAHRYKSAVSTLIAATKNVALLGSIHQVPEAMAASNVIVFPATVGHFARPIIEAGFMKKPVIASKLAPLDELVAHEKTGYLLDPYDYEAWAQKLQELLSNSTLQQKLGQEAFTMCTKQFNLDGHASAIQSIYSRLLSKGEACESNSP